MQPIELRREIGLGGAVAYGVGITIGAGIYALLGLAAGLAGNALWLSFGLAALLASFTGLSYAKLSSLFPTSGAEFVYVQRAFRSRFLAFIVGWLVILSGVVSIATVALAFGGYMRAYLGLPEVLIATILIVALSMINFFGIRESVRAYIILTAIEIFGIILVIAFGAPFLGRVDYLSSPSGTEGVASALAIVFFAFLGFEGLAKIGDETKNPSVTLPRALLITLALSTALYMLLAVAVVSVIPYNELASSSSPLVDVATEAQGSSAAALVSLIALLSTGNGVLIILISISRIVFGMAREASLPPILAEVHHKRRTPWIAVIFTMVASVVFTLIGDIKIVVSIANSTIFLVFFAVNASLISLVWERPVSKLARLKSASIPIMGATSSVLLLTQFDALTLISVAGLIILGGIINRLLTRGSQP